MKNTDLNKDPIAWNIHDILDATGGRLVAGESAPPFRGFFIDSRITAPGSAFVAIKGKIHDGHFFVHEIVKNGCSGLVINEDSVGKVMSELREFKGLTVISVQNTTEALGLLAKYQRARSGVKLVAVTGSSGKTSTRAMTASIMSERFKTLSTTGNLNNDIGLPITLLGLSDVHEWAIVELGASAPGEIGALSQIARPDIGIITNIGQAHLEGFGSIEGVAKAKSELVYALDENGIAILNANDPFLRKTGKECGKKVLYYGTEPDADIRGSLIENHTDRIIFDIFLPDGQGRVELKTPGPFMMMNALAAAAAAWSAGIGISQICSGLNGFKPEKGRLAVKISAKGAKIIDDTYNANPSSMLAAIETLASVKGHGRAFLVCGDMLELGHYSSALHEEIGRAAAGKGIDGLFVFGSFSEYVKKGALEAGMTIDRIHTGDKAELAEAVMEKADADDWILVKGSRSMQMEEIVEKLVKQTEKTEERI